MKSLSVLTAELILVGYIYSALWMFASIYAGGHQVPFDLIHVLLIILVATPFVCLTFTYFNFRATTLVIGKMICIIMLLICEYIFVVELKAQDFFTEEFDPVFNLKSVWGIFLSMSALTVLMGFLIAFKKPKVQELRPTSSQQ